MPNNDDGGYSTDRSAFGGFMLSAVPKADAGAVKKLESYGITDAEQVLALAELPQVRPALEKALDGADVDKLVKALRDEVGDVAADAAAASSPATLPLGAMEPTDEVKAEMAAMTVEAPPGADAVALPASINHALSMSPVRNQGSRGTCVAFAMTAMHEFYRRKTGFPQDFSEQFLYDRTKQIDGIPASCGTWAVKAAQVLANLGQCREAIWAYNPSPPCNNNGVMPGTALADAAHYKLACIVLNPKNVAAIKAALASGCTCEFSIPVFNSWYLSAATRNTGRINMPLPGEGQVGGHAMCFIGYQDDAASPGGGFFILRNSWSASWGAACPYGAGNGTIPYAYIANNGWEAVTTNVPRRRWFWDDWRRIDPRPFGEEGGGDAGPNPRRTIVIEDDNADVVIR